MFSIINVLRKQRNTREKRVFIVYISISVGLQDIHMVCSEEDVQFCVNELKQNIGLHCSFLEIIFLI
jgi:hypothetical protein